MLKALLAGCLMPPANCLLLAAAGALLWRRRRRSAVTCLVLAVVLLWLQATPLVAGSLLGALQVYPALPATGALPPADAIVVLSAEADRTGAEFGGPVVGQHTLARLRYAAALQRRTGLPVLCSGGRPGEGLPPLADLMAESLARDFRVDTRWREDRSADTAQNAGYSAEMLLPAGVKTVLLVTHAWHMPRSVAAFERAGLQVVPAPTAFRGPAWEGLRSLSPGWPALRDTGLALHEWLGRLWYSVRG